MLSPSRTSGRPRASSASDLAAKQMPQLPASEFRSPKSHKELTLPPIASATAPPIAPYPEFLANSAVPPTNSLTTVTISPPTPKHVSSLSSSHIDFKFPDIPLASLHQQQQHLRHHQSSPNPPSQEQPLSARSHRLRASSSVVTTPRRYSHSSSAQNSPRYHVVIPTSPGCDVDAEMPVTSVEIDVNGNVVISSSPSSAVAAPRASPTKYRAERETVSGSVASAIVATNSRSPPMRTVTTLQAARENAASGRSTPIREPRSSGGSRSIVSSRAASPVGFGRSPPAIMNGLGFSPTGGYLASPPTSARKFGSAGRSRSGASTPVRRPGSGTSQGNTTPALLSPLTSPLSSRLAHAAVSVASPSPISSPPLIANSSMTSSPIAAPLSNSTSNIPCISPIEGEGFSSIPRSSPSMSDMRPNSASQTGAAISPAPSPKRSPHHASFKPTPPPYAASSNSPSTSYTTISSPHRPIEVGSTVGSILTSASTANEFMERLQERLRNTVLHQQQTTLTAQMTTPTK